jgi:ATP-dependent RNA helicase DHX57
MSATLHSEALAAHFECPVLTVPGRMFPVTEHYLSDAHAVMSAGQVAQRGGGGTTAGGIVQEDLLTASPSHGKDRGQRKGRGGGRGAAGGGKAGSVLNASMSPPHFDAEIVAEFVIRLIQQQSKRRRSSSVAIPGEGGDAVLVFLPGIQAIDSVNRVLRARRVLEGLNAYVCILHSTVPPAQQRRAFMQTSPGQWKIVLSTNIAESSVTVNDVTHVVDCGLVKEMRFDPSVGISSLKVCHASKASMQQRKGRAGIRCCSLCHCHCHCHCHCRTTSSRRAAAIRAS